MLLSTFKKTHFCSENKSVSMSENFSTVSVEEKVANIEQGRTDFFIFYIYLSMYLFKSYFRTVQCISNIMCATFTC